MTREEAEKYDYLNETRTQEQETEQRLQIQATIRRLKDRDHIQSVMRIDEFLNPVEEVVEDTEEDLEDHIVAIYDGHESEYETEEEEVIVSRVQNKDALRALETLRLYEEQREVGDDDLIRRLNRKEWDIKTSMAISSRQVVMTDFFAIR